MFCREFGKLDGWASSLGVFLCLNVLDRHFFTGESIVRRIGASHGGGEAF